MTSKKEGLWIESFNSMPYKLVTTHTRRLLDENLSTSELCMAIVLEGHGGCVESEVAIVITQQAVSHRTEE